MKRILPALWLLFFLLTALPARSQEKLKPFIFTPQWTAQAQFAGYYVALELGFYAEEGLDVKIEHPSPSESAFERIRSERSDATTLQLVQAMEIVDMNIELVNILQTSMENALMIVPRHGEDPMSLRGAKVATWRAGFSQIAECMSSEKLLDYEWIQAADFLNLFIAGAVDAALAMSYNEYYELLQTGLVDVKDKVYRFSEHGYNIQEDGVYMTRARYKKDPEMAQAFARASRRGWEWAVGHPEETLDIVMDFARREYAATNRVLQRLMLEEVLRLQIDRDSGEREFRLLRPMVEQASDLMMRNGMLRRKVTYEELLP